MSAFKCKICNYQTFVKADLLKKHYSIHHKDEEPGYDKVRVDILCTFCGKSFSTKANLTRHLHICKIKLKDEDDNKKLQDRIEELRIENQKLQEKLKNPTSNTTTNNNNNISNTTNITNTQINNNNYITISLTPYNDPNMQGMQPYLEAALRKTFLSVPNLIESVHFNKEYPENQNICITNRRTKDAKVFDGKKWKTINKDILINEIVDTYERELTSYAEEKGKTKFIKDYESAKKRGNGEKDLKEEVHNVIYDNSEMVNTKIKEVQKLIKIKPVKKEENTEENTEEENTKKEEDEEVPKDVKEENNEDSDSEPPVDQYAEYQRIINDSESEEE